MRLWRYFAGFSHEPQKIAETGVPEIKLTQSLDDTGVAATASNFFIQTFQVSELVLVPMFLVAQTVVLNKLTEKVDTVTGKRHGGMSEAKSVINRLMYH